jgi:hypothetical protein
MTLSLQSLIDAYNADQNINSIRRQLWLFVRNKGGDPGLIGSRSKHYYRGDHILEVIDTTRYIKTHYIRLITLIKQWMTTVSHISAVRGGLAALTYLYKYIQEDCRKRAERRMPDEAAAYPITILPEEYHEFAAIHLLRSLIVSPTVHMGIRWSIVSADGRHFLTAVRGFLGNRAELPPLPDDFVEDLRFAVAVDMIASRETRGGHPALSADERAWRRAVHLGRDLIRRWHLLQYDGRRLTPYCIYDFLMDAETVEEAVAAAAAAGVVPAVAASASSP